MLDPALQATFEACLDAVHQGDIAAFEACFHERAEGFTTLAGTIRGPRSFRYALQALRALLPDLQAEVVRTYGEGPELAARMRLRQGGREAEAVFAFRFDPEARIERLIVLWEPATFLEVAPGELDSATRDAVERYFQTYNEDDEDAHMALVAPSLVYFGAVSRITAEGIGTARGIFRGAHDRMGISRLEVIRILGVGPNLAVLVRIYGKGAGGPTDEGVWVFRLDEHHRFDRVSVLWNPTIFLTWDHK